MINNYYNRTFRQLALLKRPDIGSTTSLVTEKEWDNTLINWAIQYAVVRYSSWLISIFFYVFTYIKGLIPLDRKSVLKLRLFIVSPTFNFLRLLETRLRPYQEAFSVLKNSCQVKTALNQFSIIYDFLKQQFKHVNHSNLQAISSPS